MYQEEKTQRKQFNVYLDRTVIRDLKYECIRKEERLNRKVEEIFRDFLACGQAARVTSARAGMTVFFMTENYDQMCAYYQEALQVKPHKGKRWCVFPVAANVIFALHRVTEKETGPIGVPNFAFHFGDVDEGLKVFLKAGGEIKQEVIDVGYGRSAKIRDPEGRVIELDEYNK